jgi:hypothetical protein
VDLATIAKAVLIAQDAHEGSYNDSENRYTADYKDCFEAACQQLGLPVSLVDVLYLANTWSNDLRIWANSVMQQSNSREFTCDDTNG